MFFLKEIGIRVEVSGTNTSLDHSALYMFVNVGSTLGLGDVFPEDRIPAQRLWFCSISSWMLNLDIRPGFL